jgi:hypothetical protein
MSQPAKNPKPHTQQDAGKPLQHGDREHGEGNYKAARDYDHATEKFAKSGKVEPAARAAQPRSHAEAEDLEHAEAEGKSRSKGEDPAVGRGRR